MKHRQRWIDRWTDREKAQNIAETFSVDISQMQHQGKQNATKKTDVGDRRLKALDH